MSEKKSKNYTAEFKESAVKLVVESDQLVAQTARELEVIHTWIDKYHRSKQDNKAAKNEEHLYDEVKRLRKENARLKEERAILKNCPHSLLFPI
ncbi:transposase [Spartinivicinus marinus]|uniref:transposase n=1 Tax=Spartinivicinus marinus TaxID=2994442 RepID=UPI00224D691D|nr:transposase [Spartinivicinus marinus]MCX4025829.1 transposase [Spartinivicinus marinus]